MNFKRIIIIGCGGSGKSTLAIKLGEKLSIPVIHLDKLYWRAGWKHVSMEEFDNLLQAELMKDSWIMDGNFNRTIEKRIEYCDIIIYLDYARITCLSGAIKRVLKNYGRTRKDMGVDCPERFDFEFIKWIWNFNKNYRYKYHDIISKAKNKEIYILRSRRECKELLTQL